ncbi:hypothetical protein ZHAS_00010767 [Anopheles sinensis]|uniref:Uncharacterized protein n=1 Tax=Anopheles sinensis TaxID=74873 RepID=A0A084VY77_ANOSI|nr:hypothetical protein ZHAS_00010767 [Anopheles sinensis]
MTRPERSSRSTSRERESRFDQPRHHVEHSGTRGVRIFTGNEKQPKVFCNPVIFNQDATRNQPYQENDWDNNERTPNRAADRVANPDEYRTANGSYDVRRSLLENALTIAFLAANSNQLRMLTSSNSDRQDTITYRACLALVILSLILQTLNGVAMLLMSTHTSQRWPLLRTLACIAATTIALVNLGVVTMLNVLLESS